MVQSAASPYVTVRYGRREDRAAAYDELLLACTRCAGATDGTGVEDVWAAVQAVAMRARQPVVREAQKLATAALTIAAPDRAGLVRYEPTPRELLERQGWEPYGTEENLRWAVEDFVRVARADLDRHWWNVPVWVWRDVRRWWAFRSAERRYFAEEEREFAAWAGDEGRVGRPRALSWRWWGR